jgi:hypothetical protein
LSRRRGKPGRSFAEEANRVSGHSARWRYQMLFAGYDPPEATIRAIPAREARDRSPGCFGVQPVLT